MLFHNGELGIATVNLAALRLPLSSGGTIDAASRNRPFMAFSGGGDLFFEGAPVHDPATLCNLIDERQVSTIRARARDRDY
jgi:hypothetical protein